MIRKLIDETYELGKITLRLIISEYYPTKDKRCVYVYKVLKDGKLFKMSVDRDGYLPDTILKALKVLEEANANI